MPMATPPIGLARQACNRCRKHKLRCTRADDAGACDRCLRKGAQCTYSSSLPKGRRSTHTGNPTIGGDTQTSISDNATSGFRETGSWSSGMDWDGFQFNMAVEGSSTATDSSFDWLCGVNSAQCDDVATSSTTFTGSQNEGSEQLEASGSGSGTCGEGIDCYGDSKDDPEVLIAQLAQLSTQISSLRRSGCVLVKESTSSSLTCHMQTKDQNQAHQSPLLDDAIFQSVGTWLARGPTDNSPPCSLATSHACWAHSPKIKTLGDLLSEIFSASHHLLELLRNVPGGSTSNTARIPVAQPTPQFLDFATPPLDMDGITPLGSDSGQELTWKTQPSSPIASSNNVIRHLLIANHTMLLGVYSEIFNILQRCAEPNTSEGTAPLQQIKLVSVVQLCSYLIDRQHQAVDLYLASPIGCLLEPETVPDTMTTDAMKAIRSEVGQQIQRLQQMVQI